MSLQLDGALSSKAEIEGVNSELKRNNVDLKRQLDKWQNLETKGGAEIEEMRKRRIELEVRVKELEGRVRELERGEKESAKALEKERKKVEKRQTEIDKLQVRGLSPQFQNVEGPYYYGFRHSLKKLKSSPLELRRKNSD